MVDTRRNTMIQPTRTLGISGRWEGQFNKRYRKLKGAINNFILKDNSKKLLTNVYQFGSDVNRLNEFMAFLEIQIDNIIYSNQKNYDNFWQNKYILDSYDRGVLQAEHDIKRALPKKLKKIVYPAEISFPVGALVTGGALKASATALPIHQQALQLIYSRDFSDLKGVTDQMSMRISGSIANGMELGKGSVEIARDINKVVDSIGLVRSRLIARTETVRVFNISGVSESERVSDVTGIPAKYQWLTTLDGRERLQHKIWGEAKEPVSKDVYLSRIGAYNCRCSHVVIFPNEKSEELNF